jgi:hypothetical protein
VGYYPCHHATIERKTLNGTRRVIVAKVTYVNMPAGKNTEERIVEGWGDSAVDEAAQWAASRIKMLEM